jgi:hypothetical protein
MKTINSQIRHELRGGNRLKCPHPKCARLIKSDQFCCGLHWRHIPSEIRNLIFENGPGVISDRGREQALIFWGIE